MQNLLPWLACFYYFPHLSARVILLKYNSDHVTAVLKSFQWLPSHSDKKPMSPCMIYALFSLWLHTVLPNHFSTDHWSPNAFPKTPAMYPPCCLLPQSLGISSPYFLEWAFPSQPHVLFSLFLQPLSDFYLYIEASLGIKYFTLSPS